ncbi:MAG: PcfJ domain-containing protein, partial [Clostridia bacterium]|nr:PcfJ domain-containing protein [Clostridia bacterium]
AKAMKDAEERKELYAKFAGVAEKYLSLQRNKEAFIVIIARTPSDLMHEGDTLHHCVGRMNYDQKFAREESLIFFVRNATEPDTPFVTLEYSLKSKKILQCYGDGDSKPNDGVLEFVNKKWLPFANRQLKKIQAAA